jgi:lipopolysaccharide export system protein LptA
VKKLVFVVLFQLGLSVPAQAAMSGQVGQLDIYATQSAKSMQGLRVYLQGNPVICNNQIWAYADTADGNYKAMVASLLAAKYSNSTIKLSVVQDIAGNCRLSAISSN